MPRPRINIDKQAFESLCALQCTLEEIAGFFSCSPDTIERWCNRTYLDEEGKPLCFAEVFKQKRTIGRISLRRAQNRLAMRNATMAIWLGKQWLGQTDTGASQSTAIQDDGFIEALSETASEDWSDADIPV